MKNNQKIIREKKETNLESSAIESAAQVIKDGGVILYPTDTVWGLGCDATNPKAVEKIFNIKQRDEKKSLVILVANLDMLARYVKEIPNIALDLIEVNTSPMTIIYPQAQGLADNAIAEDGSVAIRIPMTQFCQKLSYKTKKPIISTSANISGEETPKRFKDIPEEIKNAVNYIVPHTIEEKSSTHKASQIIKVGVKGEIEIIRK